MPRLLATTALPAFAPAILSRTAPVALPDTGSPGEAFALALDALVPPGDIAYLPSEGHFMMALNRFRWEAAGDAPPYSRTHSGLRLDKVTAVQRRGFSRWEKDKMLSLLSIAYADDEDGGAGGGTVRLNPALRATSSRACLKN